MPLEVLRRDLRHAIRQLVRSPVHSSIAILVLAIGIGANTAVFSVVNPLLLKPLPFPEAERLVWIANAVTPGLSGQTYRVDAYEALAERSRSFESMSAYFAFFGFRGLVLSGAGVPERLTAVEVAPRFLEVLGVEPRIGRRFAETEYLQGGPRAAVLTDGLWRRRFQADASIAGQTITINDEPYVVAGVLPAGFDFVLKAPRRITHVKRLREVGEEVRHLQQVASTLGGKPGPLFYQLPPTLEKDLGALRALLAASAEARRAAFEFRHPSWDGEDTVALLHEYGAAPCLAETDEVESPAISTGAVSFSTPITVRRSRLPVCGSRSSTGIASKRPSSKKKPFSLKSAGGAKLKLSRRGTTRLSTTARPGFSETDAQTSRAEM